VAPGPEADRPKQPEGTPPSLDPGEPAPTPEGGAAGEGLITDQRGDPIPFPRPPEQSGLGRQAAIDHYRGQTAKFTHPLAPDSIRGQPRAIVVRAGDVAKLTAILAEHGFRIRDRGSLDGERAILVIDDPDEWNRLIRLLTTAGVGFDPGEPSPEQLKNGSYGLGIWGPESDVPVSWEDRRADLPRKLTPADEATPGEIHQRTVERLNADSNRLRATGLHGLWKQRHRLRWIDTLGGDKRRAAEQAYELEQEQFRRESKRLAAEVRIRHQQREFQLQWDRFTAPFRGIKRGLTEFGPELLESLSSLPGFAASIAGIGVGKALNLIERGLRALNIEPSDPLRRALWHRLRTIDMLDPAELNWFEEWAAGVYSSALRGVVSPDESIRQIGRGLHDTAESFRADLRAAAAGDPEAIERAAATFTKLFVGMKMDAVRRKVRTRRGQQLLIKQATAQRLVRAKRAGLKQGIHEYPDGSRVTIDSHGRTTQIEVDDLKLRGAGRDKHIERQVGHVGGEGFEGGHLYGSQFGGASEIQNLVPMTTKLNKSAFAKIEKQLAAALKAGDEVTGYRVKVNWGDRLDIPDSIEVRATIKRNGVEIRVIGKKLNNVE
jgi:hypothetical protein